MQVPRSDPSTQGVDPRGLVDLLVAWEDDPVIEPHGLIVQRHGHRIAEAHWAPHTPDRLRLVYSLSKSFTSTALALQVGEGRLALDDLASRHLPDATSRAVGRARDIRIRHLASMSTGHDHEMWMEAHAADPDDVVRGFFGLEPPHEPGTAFAYSQPPVLALATILQDLAGAPLSEYLRPRLLEPLGIPDLRWKAYRPGLEPGFTGVYTTLDAVARLGQLLLDDGVVDGRRLLPEGWIDAASHRQVANPGEPNPDWQQGYGFGFWMSRHGYRGDGAFGQLMVVLPEHDTVVAAFANTTDMQGQLDHLWRHLLPALRDESSASGPGDEELAEQLAAAALPTAAERLGWAPPDPAPGRFAPGPAGSTTHQTVDEVEIGQGAMVIREGDSRLEVPISAAWTTSTHHPVAASAASHADGRLAVDVVLLDTPHRLEVVVDPATSTFDASWPAMPLFRAGLDPPLVSMVAPPPAAQ